MDELVAEYFLKSGIGWAMMGAAAATMLGCAGSARGIRIAAGQAAGALSEKPELFGKLFVLMVLPGTQGFYGLVCTVMIAQKVGVLASKVSVAPLAGFGLLFVGIATGYALLKSAVYQGETSAACINLTARRPDQGGRAILLPVLVETYAVVALLFAILIITFLPGAEGL